MAFTQDIKEELIKKYSKNGHCQKAEFLGMALILGNFEEGAFTLPLDSEAAAKKNFTTLRKNYSIEADVPEHRTKNKVIYRLSVKAPDAGRIEEALRKNNLKSALERECCKRAFLRGAFIAGGTASNPEQFYQMEIAGKTKENCELLCRVMQYFGLNAKITKRRDKYFTYIKDSEEISDLLNIMEAHVAMMNFENVRVVREVRGNINRQVNCETANLQKTVAAAYKQAEDIKLIKETIGFAALDENLKEIAEIRLKNPDVPLGELGNLLTPPIGKSGVNHRLRKISQIAEDIRKKEEKDDQ